MVRVRKRYVLLPFSVLLLFIRLVYLWQIILVIEHVYVTLGCLWEGYNAKFKHQRDKQIKETKSYVNKVNFLIAMPFKI